MPGESAVAKDVQNIAITVTNSNSQGGTGSSGSHTSSLKLKVPWGYKNPGEALGVLKDIEAKLIPLLDAVQRAHREGQLGPDGDERLAYLQSWYTCLKEQICELEKKPEAR